MKSVTGLWQQYIGEQHQFLTEDLLGLSPNQRTLLRALANQPTQEVYSARFLASCQLSTASTKQALGVLIKKDFIFKEEDNIYSIVDPALDYYLTQRFTPNRF